MTAAVIGSVGMPLLRPQRFAEPASHNRRRAPMIIDPMLRPRNGDPNAESRYDQALNALIEAQRRLSQALDSRSDPAVDIDTLRNDVKAAEATAVAARPSVWSTPVIEARTLLLLFHKTATPAQIAGVLLKHRLNVLSSVPDISFFVVDVADGGGGGDEIGSPELESSLLWARIRELEQEESGLQTAVVNLPLHGMTIPSQPQWAAGNPSLVLSRFPQAWNFEKAIDRRNHIVDVGVVDEGFANADAQTPVTDLPMTFPPGCFGGGSSHGTQVAGVAGATWGNAMGTDGAAPHVNLVGCVAPTAADMAGTLNTLFTNASTVRVINASLGYNWNGPTTTAMQDVAAGHGAIVRAAMQNHSDVMLVSSAGNDCDNRPNCADPATFASPFNWAALGPSADLPPSENIIVVQALDSNMTRLPLSNVSPMIGAIGEGLQTVFGSGSFGVMGSSTSAATPLVTATVAMMLELETGLSISDIKTNLGIPGGKLDAFKALLASSRTPDKDLADRTGDGNVDLQDFAIFKASFHRPAADQNFDQCDFDGDGDVDLDDLKVMMRAWTDGNVDPNSLPGRL
jgi:Subtilase family